MDWQIQPSEFKWSDRQCCRCEKTAKVTFPFIFSRNLDLNSVKKKKSFCLAAGWRNGNKKLSVTRREHRRKRKEKIAAVWPFFQVLNKQLLIDQKINKSLNTISLAITAVRCVGLWRFSGRDWGWGRWRPATVQHRSHHWSSWSGQDSLGVRLRSGARLQGWEPLC